MKLIQTKDYLLLIEKIYVFKVGDWNYEEDNTIPVYQFNYDIDEYPGNKIIAYYPLTKEAKELEGLPLLPNPFEPAQQFSLEDMETLMEEALNWFGGERDKNISDSKEFFEKYIQSLSTQQLPKEFIPEYEIIITKYIPYPKELEVKGQDYEVGYPVTEKVQKTITNSEGKQEIQGRYVY